MAVRVCGAGRARESDPRRPHRAYFASLMRFMDSSTLVTSFGLRQQGAQLAGADQARRVGAVRRSWSGCAATLIMSAAPWSCRPTRSCRCR